MKKIIFSPSCSKYLFPVLLKPSYIHLSTAIQNAAIISVLTDTFYSSLLDKNTPLNIKSCFVKSGNTYKKILDLQFSFIKYEWNKYLQTIWQVRAWFSVSWWHFIRDIVQPIKKQMSDFMRRFISIRHLPIYSHSCYVFFFCFFFSIQHESDCMKWTLINSKTSFWLVFVYAILVAGVNILWLNLKSFNQASLRVFLHKLQFKVLN